MSYIAPRAIAADAAMPSMALTAVTMAAQSRPAEASALSATVQPQASAPAIATSAASTASITPAATVPQMARAQSASPAPTVSKPANTTAHTATPFAPARHDSAAGSIGGTVLALVLVVGLILALGSLARRMPGVGGASSKGLRVVGSLPLGPRDRVVVVEVGSTQLLIGVGPGGMRTLHTLEEPLPVAPAPSTPPFAQLLAQHFGKKA